MVISVKHKKVSEFEDSEEAAAAGELLPSDWNDDHEVIGAAPIDSPEFLNEPTAPTPPQDDVSERLATTQSLAYYARPKRQIVVSAGPVTIAQDVGLVILAKTSPEATVAMVPLSTLILGDLITIKDRMGANSFPTTLQASGSETIDGRPTTIIDVDNMALGLRPIRDADGEVTGEGYIIV